MTEINLLLNSDGKLFSILVLYYNFLGFCSRKISSWQVKEDVKFDRKISEKFDPEVIGDSNKIKIDYYRQPSNEVTRDPRDIRALPKPASKEFKEALMIVSDSNWIRGEPPKHVLIHKISPKQVKSELNLYARLEEHFQISESDIININLHQVNSECFCASVLFVSGFKAWEFARSFVKDQGGFSWEVRIDPSAKYFERMKESKKEHHRDSHRDHDDYKSYRKDDYLDDYRSPYKTSYKSTDSSAYRSDDKSSYISCYKSSKLSCSSFVPCLKIPFSCEMTLDFRLEKSVLLSLFPESRFPSISGVEEGSTSWHIHFGREIDVVEADRMLQKDVFSWEGHKFYFDKWDLMKNDIPWDIPGHYTNKPVATAKLSDDKFEEFLPAFPLAFEDSNDGDYTDLPKFKKKRIEPPPPTEDKDESGIKVKVKRKAMIKKPSNPMPVIKLEQLPLETEIADESVKDVEMKEPVEDVEMEEEAQVQEEIIVKIDEEIECPILESGAVRTEGYFRLEAQEKSRVKFKGILEAFSSSIVTSSNVSNSIGSNDGNSGRSSRAQNRRPLLQTSANVTMDLFKVSPLQSTQKVVALRNSSIHSYGLVLMEPAEPGDLIIEYVGELVRASVANIREWKYEREYCGDGIASSYLFRLDGIMVIDATHQGNLARFINHSCDPNCVAKTITLNGSKRIVMYAKKSIRAGEEITYDYKFPTEKDPKKKVKCLCGSSSCRKYLN